MKKGISLPIEMIVIIAIAVLVLVVIAAFFVGGFGKLPGGLSDNAAFAAGCNLLRTTHNCATDPSQITVPNYKPPGYTTDQTLGMACTNLGYSVVPDAEGRIPCRVACGCPT